MSLIFAIIIFLVQRNTPGSADHGFSSHCQRCITPCENSDGYFWCRTYAWIRDDVPTSWDYCSPNATLEYHGKICSSACAFHGEIYQWCTSGESWGYCTGDFCGSQTGELPDHGYSTHCQQCITPCQKTESYYYWCGTRQWKLFNKTLSWDYCSPDSGVDYQGNKCLDYCQFRDDLLYMSCPTGKTDAKGYCTGGKGHVLCDYVQPFE